MFCKKCGTMLHADATQCSNCGEPTPPKPVQIPYPSSMPPPPQPQYYAASPVKGKTTWISFARFCAWLTFFAIIAGGSCIGGVVNTFLPRPYNDGFVVFIAVLVSIVAAFAAVSNIMIMLDQAADIRAIKNMLAEKLHRDQMK